MTEVTIRKMSLTESKTQEVTICFSYLPKGGLRGSSLERLNILHGWSIDGTKNTKSRKIALKLALFLLAQMSSFRDDLYMHSPTLCERKSVNTPDDLNTKNTTHAKGE